MKSRTGAETYLRRRLEDPEYAAAYKAARSRIAQIDDLLRAIDARRAELGISKAELGRRAGLKPEAVRRLLTSVNPNPTLSTLIAIADSLDLAVAMVPEPRRGRPSKRVKASPSGAA